MTAIAKEVAAAAGGVPGQVAEHRQIQAANDRRATPSVLGRVIEAMQRIGRGISLTDFTHLSATLNWRG